MSRVAKAPVSIASGVEVTISGQEVAVKGKNGTLTRVFNDAVEVVQEENTLKVALVKVLLTGGLNQVQSRIAECNGNRCVNRL